MCQSRQVFNYKEILYMKFRQPITRHILRLLICDALTKLFHLLKVDSLGYQNNKLILWGFGIVLDVGSVLEAMCMSLFTLNPVPPK